MESAQKKSVSGHDYRFGLVELKEEELGIEAF
jgi:hypothetical protein